MSILACTRKVILISSFAETIGSLLDICHQIRTFCLQGVPHLKYSRFRYEYVMLLLWLARDDHHLAFLGLAEARVVARHCATLTEYCEEVAYARNTEQRLQLMVSQRLLMIWKLHSAADLGIEFSRNTAKRTAGW